MNLQEHTRIITKHAALIQENKAKAYAHDFAKSKKAISSALKNLNAQLHSGHKHDKKALAGARTFGNGVIKKAENGGLNKCQSYKHKSCPTKRLEQEAKSKKDAAAKGMANIGNGKICGHIAHHTLGDMDIDKATPAYGTSLRNAWDKTRAKYVAAHKRHAAAVKAYNSAKSAYDKAMSALGTAISIEASNAHSQCKAAHSEYTALHRDVESNVKSRKQVWISSLVVGCYMDNLTSNSAAKACADRKRRSGTNHWNIKAGKLSACKSKATLSSVFGPTHWKPSTKTCHHKHWHAKAEKKKAGPSGPSKTITSNGTAKRPHCSWNRWCKWTAATKENCAQGLCKASGYKNGKFVKASNDMCKKSFVRGQAHFYCVKKNLKGMGKVVKGGHSNDAQITAKCSN